MFEQIATILRIAGAIMAVIGSAKIAHKYFTGEPVNDDLVRWFIGGVLLIVAPTIASILF